jgi:hypothetical protein
MGRAGEVLAGHFGEDAGAGPDADAGHRGQDLVKRVGLHKGFNLGVRRRRAGAAEPACSASFGSTIPAALVPTTTLSVRRAQSKTASVSRSAARGACFFSRFDDVRDRLSSVRPVSDSA